jgi:hypothetical protein
MSKQRQIFVLITVFLTVVILDALAFGILIPIFFEKYLVGILTNTIFSWILFFWLFLGLPLLAAYLFTFVFRRKKAGNRLGEEFLKEEVKKQFKPIFIIPIALGIFLIGFVVRMGRIDRPAYSLKPIEPGELEKPTPTPILTPTPTLAPTPILNLKKPTPTPTVFRLTPTSAPTAGPTTPPTSTPIPEPENKLRCEINVDPQGGPDPLTVNMSYVVLYIGNDAYVTGIQWDFENDGSWDTDLSLANSSVSHTYVGVGIYTIRMQVRLSDGRMTDACFRSIAVQSH